MIERPRYFILQEFIPRSLFQQHAHEQDKLWGCMDGRVLWTADAIRKRFGKMIMNTWFFGGIHQERGVRLFGTETGAPLSQHKFGRAGDMVPIEVTAEEIRKDILTHPGRQEYQYIRCIEEGTSWFHFDVRNWTGPILIVKP